MADEITIRKETTAPHPEGQYQAVCVDVVNLGEKLEQYQSQPPEVWPKVAIVFQSKETNPDTGKRYELSQEFTVSFGKKANLRKFLGNWRGKQYTDDEATKGIPLHKIVGHNCFLTVEHKLSAAGNTYAKLSNVTPIPQNPETKQPLVKLITEQDYQRAPFWEERKKEYAARVAEFRSMHAPTSEEPIAAVLAKGDDDDLPF